VISIRPRWSGESPSDIAGHGINVANQLAELALTEESHRDSFFVNLLPPHPKARPV
jgi:hypothetical protein